MSHRYEKIYNEGKAAFEKGDYKEALRKYDEVFTTFGRSIHYHLTRAEALHKLNKIQDAIDAWDKALQYCPAYDSHDKKKIGCLKGWAYRDLGNNAEAIASFEFVLSFDSNLSKSFKRPEAFLGLAEVFFDLGQFDKALEYHDKAIKDDPRLAKAHFSKGFTLHKLDRSKEALPCVEEAVKLDPKDIDAYLLKAQIYEHFDENEDAIDCCNEAIKLDPNHTKAHFFKGYLLHKMGKMKEATVSLSQAMKLESNLINDPQYADILLHCVDAFLQTGIDYSKEGKLQEALGYFEQVLKIDNYSKDAFYQKALVLNRLGKKQDAVACFDKAIESSPEQFDLYVSKSNVLKALGKKEKLIDCWNQAIKFIPKSAVAHYEKGLALYELSRTQEAVPCFTQALKLDPNLKVDVNLVDAYLEVGLAYSDVGQMQEALTYYEQAIKVNPNNALAHYRKGYALSGLKKNAEALLSFDQAIKLDPNDALAYCGKGRFLNSMGQDELALACFNKANELIESHKHTKVDERNKNYINRVLSQDRVALIKKLTELQQATIETGKISETLDPKNEIAAKIIQKFKQLKERKTELADVFFNSFEKKSSNSSGNSTTDQTAKVNQLAKEFANLKDEILAFKRAQGAHNTQVTQTIQKQQQVLQDSGAIAKAEVARGFKNLEAKEPDMYDYCKTFYWTAINLFGAYRSLSTGLVQGKAEANISVQENLLVTGAKKAASLGAEIAKGVPFVGGLIGVLDKNIDAIYTTLVEKRFENKVNAINKVMRAKFGMVDDISTNVAKLALAMTEARKQAILYPEMEIPSKFEKGANWLRLKMDQIQNYVLPSIELYDSGTNSVNLALSDVTLMMAYLCKNCDAVIRRNMQFAEQCVEILQMGGFDQMLAGFERMPNQRGPNQAPNLSTNSERPFTCFNNNENPRQCCNMF